MIKNDIVMSIFEVYLQDFMQIFYDLKDLKL